MRRIKIKRTKSGLFGITILVIIICGIVAYNKVELDAQLTNKQAEISALEDKVDDLKEEQEKLKEDKIMTKEEIESIARDKLGLVYDNQIIFKPEDK